MANRKDTVQVTFRADSEIVRQLDELCTISGVRRGQFIASAIASEYDKMQGNPQLKELLGQFRQIAETMQAISSSTGTVCSAPSGADAGEA